VWTLHCKTNLFFLSHTMIIIAFLDDQMHQYLIVCIRIGEVAN